MFVTIVFSTYIVLSLYVSPKFHKEIRLSLTVATGGEEESYMSCPKQYIMQ